MTSPASPPNTSTYRRVPAMALSACIALAGLALPKILLAQQPGSDSSSSPDPGASQPAPQSQPVNSQPAQNQSPQNPADDQNGQQTKRILGIVPNFRAVSADQKLPPESVKEKFMDATEDSFDYSSIFFPAVVAAYNQARNATPEFHQGAAGYARYFWHSAVDQTSENYMVEFIFPTITREDGRYYTLGHGGFFKRTGYALSRAVITRTDSGKETFNISEVVGAGSAAGLSNLYYPRAERTLGNTGSQWGLDIGIDAGVFVFREFWPDINRHVFRNKYGHPPATQ